MTVTATEFKVNFGKYLELSRSEDVFITKNNKTIARVSNPASDRVASLNAIAGIASSYYSNLSDDDIKERRLARQ